MHIVMMASGTRGDVQPMIALGMALRDMGHHIRIVAGSNFANWIESFGLEAFPTADVEAMMQSELGVKWVESTQPLDQLKYMKALMNSVIDITLRDTVSSTRDADFIVGGFVSEPYLHTIHEKFRIPYINVGLQPYRASRHGASGILSPFPRRRSVLNYAMGMLAERISFSVAREGLDALRKQLGLPLIGGGQYARVSRKIPALYAISPHVVPPVDDSNSHTTGYWFLDEPYTPPADLVNFIEAGKAPVYVGFGSMSSSDPARTVKLVADALTRAGQRGVIARGWSGKLDLELPDHIYLLDKASHSWLFPKMAAVVHHGGAGTTAAGLRAGKPTLIIPHMADQPFWGRRVYDLGVGVKAIARHKLTLENLTASLRTLVNDQRMAEKAAALGASICEENGVENARQWLAANVRNIG